MKLSARVRNLTPSATLQVKAEAAKLLAAGKEVFDFGPGEPDFDTPRHIKEAAKQALDQNFTHYTETAGILDLRTALADRYRGDFGTDYQPDEVIVGCGAKSLLFLLALAAFEEGDRVGVFAPYWVSFPDQIRLAGAEPVTLPTSLEDGMVPRAATVERALKEGPLSAIILNSPSNPSGAVIPASELDRFTALSREHGFLIISDETYEAFYYGAGPYASMAQRASQIRDRLILVSSFSKSFAMTGWRVGYALGPRELIAAIRKLQSHDATHTASFSMVGALAALREPGPELEQMKEEYLRRRTVMVEGLNQVPGVQCLEPEGAFYVFPDVRGLMSRLGCSTSGDLARALLVSCGVATVPGSAFGVEGHLRLTYATSEDRIREGLRRLRECEGVTSAGGSS